MSKLLFQDDAYLREASAIVTRVDSRQIWLDQTIFYAAGGGQPGDIGMFEREDGSIISIIDTVKGEALDEVIHLIEDEAPVPYVGEKLTLKIDWERRYRHMRFHSAMHVLCSIIKGDVTGGNLSHDKARLDFNLPDGPPEKESVNDALKSIVAQDIAISGRWITDAELDAEPTLVRTMSVQPPRGSGKIRLLDIEGIDLQPCGGTHLKSTGEIGDIFLSKIENKGKQNRRFTLRCESDL